MSRALVLVLAGIGTLTTLGACLLLVWRLRIGAERRRTRRAEVDGRIAQIVRESSPEGSTPYDLTWRAYVRDHELSGRTPRRWRGEGRG